MSLIVFKLLLPPFLILLASLAGRRWGDAIGGWLVGLPLTSGPVAAFLAIQYGADFAALATNGSLVGTAAQACFSLGYALLAHQGWIVALIGGSAAYAGAGFLIQTMPLPHWGFFALALAALAVAAKFIPHRHPMRSPIVAPWWDLPARMVVVTTLVVSITAAAAFVGAKVAGILASFPIFGAILAVFAHRMGGAATATQVLRGMVLALYGFALFFFVVGLLLVKLGVLPAFLAAVASTLIVQAGALRFIRRGQAPKTE
ncbi:MAG TPA: hypothetical protein VKR55_24440 [Bradyrhizobium sp.]|uniref:hypothetical protein n=1 Tax=Bradyrhizobium sp. TaxID=376 RepID=UPI002C44911E|nr:hypothetical protein [Bradyrhizobium sp.]HLZ05283.1 hypothetical protein [Bradyrhizobium sp.]